MSELFSYYEKGTKKLAREIYTMDKLLVVSSELGGLNSNNIHQRKIDEKLIEARLVGNWNIAYVSTIAFVNNTNSNVCIVTTILLKKQ